MGTTLGARLEITIGSETLHSEKDAAVMIGGIKRNEFLTDQGRVFDLEEFHASEITCTIPHLVDTDIPRIKAFRGNITVKYLDTGKVYSFPDGFNKEVGELKSGKAQCKFGAGVPS